MLTAVHPKLPMRYKEITKNFYVEQLGFEMMGSDYPDYLMLKKDQIEIHFFLFPDLNIAENYGMIYIRVEDIDDFYNGLISKNVTIHLNGKLETKPWNQREFSILDPDTNLLTFGASV